MFYNRFTLCLLLCVLFTLLNRNVDAQTGNWGPGVVHRGRFFGFVPAHLRNTPPEEDERSAQSSSPPSGELIQTAEFGTEDASIYDGESEEIIEPEESERFVEESGIPDDLRAELPKNWFGAAPAKGAGDVSPWWGRADYLLWWTKSQDVPALATTSPDGTAMNQAGVLGQPGTAILFGADGINGEARPGGRFTLGTWLDDCECHGVEAAYLLLGDKRASFSASDNDFSILARPFFNVEDDTQDARRIAFPAEITGNLNIEAETDLEAFEALYRLRPVKHLAYGVDFVLGYRYAELEDRIGIREFTTAQSGPLTGTTFDLVDDFRTRNRFHGGELGIVISGQPTACWNWAASAKVGLGSTNMRGTVFGETTTTTPGGDSTTSSAGLLAQGTNIGTFRRSDFAALSEYELTLRRELACGVSLSFGYTLLFWSDVARAGDQIDLGVNTSQIPPGTLMGSARPAFPFAETSFWAQGLRVGAEYNF